MSFRLSSAQLSDLATKLEDIQKSGIVVETFIMDGLKFRLDWTGTTEVVLVGVTDSDWSDKNKPVLRGAYRKLPEPGTLAARTGGH